MTSMYAAAIPVAANAIAPTRPPGRRCSRAATADQRPGQHCACADADFGPQDAGLGGEHQQQHDADECDRDACDGECLADPARVARWPAALRRRGGGGVGGGGGGGGGGAYAAAGGMYGCGMCIGGGTGCGAGCGTWAFGQQAVQFGQVGRRPASCSDMAAKFAESRATTA